MHQDIYWLTLAVLSTAVMWTPYILNSFVVRGIVATVRNPSPDNKPLSPWAQRAKAAHYNSVENLAVFAPLVLACALLDQGHAPHESTVIAAQVYFFARVAYYFVYALGIPYFRTVLFLVGFGAQITVGLHVLAMMTAG